MHFGWWIIWILVIVGVVWAISRAQQGGTSSRPQRETPMEALKRRYAEGELSTEEYEERKERLQRDQ
ncbi:SHOCT domain-containing protein [Salinibacter ruber]|uniref:Membrane protein n=1 Tax=Salinibacter ruber TaxID=146919 RepID=A0A9X2TGW1_9BACT|nr:SHOCT domain-containing protein [Salinibacter ruber]MCS3659976.1 putative membrane protein [Salinibacter ruber]MCS3709661.1 putative membrane protein [Salinibacter ruber]MCS3751473.1 putative membrane protein [Salinibacter ruber]MCS4170512.1 putative membrane protein [Salinibacter ruber]